MRGSLYTTNTHSHQANHNRPVSGAIMRNVRIGWSRIVADLRANGKGESGKAAELAEETLTPLAILGTYPSYSWKHGTAKGKNRG